MKARAHAKELTHELDKIIKGLDVVREEINRRNSTEIMKYADFAFFNGDSVKARYEVERKRGRHAHKKNPAYSKTKNYVIGFYNALVGFDKFRVPFIEKYIVDEKAAMNKARHEFKYDLSNKKGQLKGKEANGSQNPGFFKPVFMRNIGYDRREIRDALNDMRNLRDGASTVETIDITLGERELDTIQRANKFLVRLNEKYGI